MARCTMMLSLLAAVNGQMGSQHMSDVDAAYENTGLAPSQPLADRLMVAVLTVALRVLGCRMAGWDQLRNSPEKMQEVMNSFKDPEVMAKAQEMLKDPSCVTASTPAAQCTSRGGTAG